MIYTHQYKSSSTNNRARTAYIHAIGYFKFPNSTFQPWKSSSENHHKLKTKKLKKKNLKLPILKKSKFGENLLTVWPARKNTEKRVKERRNCRRIQVNLKLTKLPSLSTLSLSRCEKISESSLSQGIWFLLCLFAFG